MPTMHSLPPLSMRAPGDAGGARAGVTENAFGQNFRFLIHLHLHAARASVILQLNGMPPQMNKPSDEPPHRRMGITYL